MNKYLGYALYGLALMYTTFFFIAWINSGLITYAIEAMGTLTESIVICLISCIGIAGSLIFLSMFLPPVWIYLCWHFFVKKGNKYRN